MIETRTGAGARRDMVDEESQVEFTNERLYGSL